MRSMTAVLAASLLLVAGCSSDDEESPEESTTTSATPEVIQPTGCELTAELEGAVEGPLEATGDFNASQDPSQPSLYIFEDGSTRLTVFASEGDFPTSVTYDGKAGRFASEGDEGIDVAADGSGGSLDVVLSGMGDDLTVSGEVVCGADRPSKQDDNDKDAKGDKGDKQDQSTS